MKHLLTLLLFYLTAPAHGQTADNAKIKKSTFNSYDELRDKQRRADIKKLTYADSTFGYQVRVPDWLHLIETNSDYAWGGMLPAVDGISNALVIKAFNKKGYISFQDFKNYVVEGTVFGQAPSWNTHYTFMGKKYLGRYHDAGDAYKVYMMQGKLLYYCEYVLLETPTAYLWIDFTSTKETFDKNIGKFEEFMSGFTTVGFRQ